MPSPSAIPGPWSLVRESAVFARKHPLLLPLAGVLLALPSLCLTLYTRALNAVLLPFIPRAPSAAAEAILTLSAALVTLIPLWFLSWGTASVLLIARRRIQSRAGRSRSSWRAVRIAAQPLATPLLLTQLLRWCSVLTLVLAGLSAGMLLFLLLAPQCATSSTLAPCHATLLIIPPLLLPAAYYASMTAFVAPIVVDENLSFRTALKRSREATYGHVWHTITRILGLVIILQTPILLLSTVMDALGIPFLITDVLTAALTGISWTLGTIATASLYGALRDAVVLPKALRLDPNTPEPPKKRALQKKATRPQEVVPPAPEESSIA